MLQNKNSQCTNKCFQDNVKLDIENNVCVENCPKYEYYLDVYNKTHRKCYEKCEYCYGQGNEIINNCKECKSNFILLSELNDTNCYEKCGYYYYLDENNNYNCTENIICPEEYNKLIEDKDKCINYYKNDDKYKYNFDNKCYKQCPNGTYLYDEENICYNITQEGYYYDSMKYILKNCYNTCKYCYGKGNETNNNCKECKSNFILSNNTNCYPPL